ncbi:DUF3592 domain-containing protein [Streptomyces sp. NPDC002067]
MAGTAGKALVGMVVAALASALTVFGYGFVRQGTDGLGEASALAARGRTADGVVLARSERSGPQGSRTERIEVRFTTGDGREYRFEQGGDAAVGATVPVHYEAGHPETASLNSAATGRFLSGMLLFIGLALMVLTPVLLLLPARTVLRGAVRAIRRRRPPADRDRRQAARPGRGRTAIARR